MVAASQALPHYPSFISICHRRSQVNNFYCWRWRCVFNISRQPTLPQQIIIGGISIFKWICSSPQCLQSRRINYRKYYLFKSFHREVRSKKGTRITSTTGYYGSKNNCIGRKTVLSWLTTRCPGFVILCHTVLIRQCLFHTPAIMILNFHLYYKLGTPPHVPHWDNFVWCPQLLQTRDIAMCPALGQLHFVFSVSTDWGMSLVPQWDNLVWCSQLFRHSQNCGWKLFT